MSVAVEKLEKNMAKLTIEDSCALFALEAGSGCGAGVWRFYVSSRRRTGGDAVCLYCRRYR